MQPVLPSEAVEQALEEAINHVARPGRFSIDPLAVRAKFHKGDVPKETIARRWVVLSPALNAGVLTPEDVDAMLMPEDGAAWVWSLYTGVLGGIVPPNPAEPAHALMLVERAVVDYAKRPGKLAMDSRKAFGARSKL